MPSDPAESDKGPEMMLGAFLQEEAAEKEQVAKFELKPTPKPTLKDKQYPPGTMVVKTEYASICGSDFPGKGGCAGCNCWRRPLGYLPVLANYQICGGTGHELVGKVVEVQEPCQYKIGQRVLGMSPAYIKWLIADEFEKLSGYKADEVFEKPQGGFAEYFLSHEVVCLPVPTTSPYFDPRLFVMAQPLGTILHGMNRLDSNLVGKTVAIVGQGQNGLLWTQMIAGCKPRKLIVLDLLPERLEVAKKKYNVTHSIHVDPTMDDKIMITFVEDQVSAITNGELCDVIIDAVGHQSKTFTICSSIAKKNGILVLFGLPPGPQEEQQMSIRSDYFYKNLEYITTSTPTIDEFQYAIELLEQGRFDPSGLITHTMSFQKSFSKAYDIASNYKNGVIKVLLTFDGENDAVDGDGGNINNNEQDDGNH